MADAVMPTAAKLRLIRGGALATHSIACSLFVADDRYKTNAFCTALCRPFRTTRHESQHQLRNPDRAVENRTTAINM